MTAPSIRLRQAVDRLPLPLRDGALRAWGLAHGQWPTPLADVIQPWLTRNPVGFNDDVRRRIAQDRTPTLATFADKLLARDYAAERIDPGLLLPLLASGRRSADVDWTGLPREYACKVNHASGGVVIVADCADPSARLPRDVRRLGWRRYLVRPEHADPEQVAAVMDRWLAMPYRRHAGAYPEWAYRDIDRRLLVEPFWAGAAGPPSMLNVLCFDGPPGAYFCSVPDAEVRSTRVTWHTAEEGDVAAQRTGLDPRQWQAVVDASTALATGVDMVRVDWLIGAGGPRFSELTNYPAAGHNDYSGHSTLSAPEYEARLVALWRAAARRA